MKQLFRLCTGVVLTLVLSVSTFAGQIPCGGIVEPPPPPEGRTAATTERVITETAITLLQRIMIGF